MNYELAKQLKEAGFPQGELFPLSDKEKSELEEQGFDPDVYFPTLSELIEAVKDGKPNSFYLEFNDEWSVYEKPNPDGLWYARYYYLTPVGFIEERANTPEIAVAKLYLALKGMNK